MKGAKDNLSDAALEYHAALCKDHCGKAKHIGPGWRTVHFVRVAEDLTIPPAQMFKLLNELHVAGLYQNGDHVYGVVLCV